MEVVIKLDGLAVGIPRTGFGINLLKPKDEKGH